MGELVQVALNFEEVLDLTVSSSFYQVIYIWLTRLASYVVYSK